MVQDPFRFPLCILSTVIPSFCHVAYRSASYVLHGHDHGSSMPLCFLENLGFSYCSNRFLHSSFDCDFIYPDNLEYTKVVHHADSFPNSFIRESVSDPRVPPLSTVHVCRLLQWADHGKPSSTSRIPSVRTICRICAGYWHAGGQGSSYLWQSSQTVRLGKVIANTNQHLRKNQLCDTALLNPCSNRQVGGNTLRP